MNYILGLLLTVATTSPIALESPTSPVEAPSVATRANLPFDVKLSSKAQIEDYIVGRATSIGFKPMVALAIAKAESGLAINARNTTSTASGLFQWIDGSFRYFCMEKYGLTDSMADKDEPHIQIECALLTLKDGGISNWSESRPLWRHSLSGN